jgi:hypothetical protein
VWYVSFNKIFLRLFPLRVSEPNINGDILTENKNSKFRIKKFQTKWKMGEGGTDWKAQK